MRKNNKISGLQIKNIKQGEMKTFERILFTITFIVAFIGMLDLIKTVTFILLITSILIYLFLGHKLLLPESREGASKLLPFMVSYLIAQTICVVLFGISEWPFKETFSYVTSVILILSIVGLLIYKKRLEVNYPVKDYLIRLIICFMYSGFPVWKLN